MTEVLVLRGTLEGHNGWVTRLVTTPSNPDLLLSASRDKTLITWQLTRDEQSYGYPKRALKGHSHIVSDAVISPDGAFAISSSWDKTLRLWKLETGESVSRFVGHEGDVLSVSISSNSRHIVSGSRDKTIKVWNTVGDCVHTLKSHNDWVSTVKFFPTSESTNFLSVGWDKVVKEWDLNTLSVNADYVGHNGYVSAVTIAPDATLCASGGKDGIIVWDLSGKKVLFTLPSGDVVHDLAFSPNRYWLCAATSASIKIYNLQSQSLMDELKPEVSSAAGGKEPECISVAWSADGQSLFSGYTDNLIRVWQVMTSS